MVIVNKLEVVYDDFFPGNPTDKQLEETLYDVEAWLSELSDDQRAILTFDEVKQWFDTWDQEDDEAKYDDVHDYIRDCLRNGIHAVISTDAMMYSADLVWNVTDGDPLAAITEEDAKRFISEAQGMGYSIPEMLTPSAFVEIYNDMKPSEEEN